MPVSECGFDALLLTLDRFEMEMKTLAFSFLFALCLCECLPNVRVYHGDEQTKTSQTEMV